MRPAGAALALLALGLASTLAVASPAAGPAAEVGGGGLADWCFNVEVAVVVYDLLGGLTAEEVVAEESFVVERSVPTGSGVVGVCYNFTLVPVTASGEEAGRLAGVLRGLYEYPAVASWSDYEPPGGYARVPLLEAYWAIYRDAVEVLESRGFNASEFDDIVVLIGDLDGVSRIYYRVEPYPYVLGGFYRLEGVKGWGGLAPMTFYDLSVVQKPWPYYGVPFAGSAPPAGPETEPPIWELGDPAGYAWGLVRDHLLYHVVGGVVVVPKALRVEVTVAIVDFGDPGRVRELALQADPGRAEELAEALAPWVDVEVRVVTVNATGELLELYKNAPVDGEGYKVLPATEFLSLLADLAASISPGFDEAAVEATWPFLVLATPDPAYFSFSPTFNFTGLATSDFGVTSYPGFRDRVYRSGLSAVIAHEVGHRLGEGHPFQFNGTARWVMDFQATVMSYYDDGRAGLGGYYHYSAARIAALQAIQYYMEAAQAGVDPETLDRAEALIRDYRGADALRLLLDTLGYDAQVPQIPPSQEQPPPQPGEPLIAILTLILLIAALIAAITLRL